MTCPLETPRPCSTAGAGPPRKPDARPRTGQSGGKETARRLLLVLVVLFALSGTRAFADIGVPDGFSVQSREELVPGVDYLTLVRTNLPTVARVARVARDAAVTLRPVLSQGWVAGPPPRLERTSAMCERVHCLLAVNGDFWINGEEGPVGGVVAGGSMLRSPSEHHHQLSVLQDNRLATGTFEWSGRLVSTDLRELRLDGVNVSRQLDQLILYTPGQGPSTGTNQFGAELVFRIVEPEGELRLGHTVLVDLAELHLDRGDTPIPQSGGVLSGHGRGASALVDLWRRVQEGTASSRSLLRVETPLGVRESIGGTPILVREGRRWFADEETSFVRGSHPRTMVGWTPAREVLVVTVDGRQPGYSVGMTLEEAAAFMMALGATEALNLDGGGSSTFVVGGSVVNRTSDVMVRRGGREQIVTAPRPGDEVVGRVERPVVSALAVVAASPQAREAADAFEGESLGLPRAVPLPVPAGTDPGSNPLGGLPAVTPADEGGRPGLLPLAAALLIVVAGLAELRLRRRRARPAEG